MKVMRNESTTICCDVAETLNKLGLYSRITYGQLKECLQAVGIIVE